MSFRGVLKKLRENGKNKGTKDMKIKSGVKVNGMNTEILLATIIADDIYSKHNQELVITEITGGKHGRGSKHYIGNAVDIRTNYFTKSEAESVAKDLSEALSEQYDVVLEVDHIHIEFDPKN